MPDHEFHRWVPEYVKAGGQCIWADAPNRITGFKFTWSDVCSQHSFGRKPKESTTGKPTSNLESNGGQVDPCNESSKSSGERSILSILSSSGRKWPRPNETHEIYNAKSAWPGLEIIGVDGIRRLREFLDERGLGDLATPGALGLLLAEKTIPRSQRFWRAPWAAWKAMKDHGTAGWVDLFMKYQGSDAVVLDMNSAYPAAAMSGMPAGHCTKIFDDYDASQEAWTYGHYTWRLSSDPGVVDAAKYTVLALGHHSNAELTSQWVPEPDATGEGWYTGVEAQAARNSNAFSEFVLDAGWGWSEVSSSFFEWVQRLDAAKAHYKALGEAGEIELGWVKRMSVAPFGRFAMDLRSTAVYAPEGVAAEGHVWEQNYGHHKVEFQTVKVPPKRKDPTKLPQLAIHVWASTRIRLASVMQRAHAEGWTIYMCAVDGIYAQPRVRGATLLGLDLGVRAGQWKQKSLIEADIPAAGTVKGRLASGEKYVKMPGVRAGDPRRQ